MKFFNLILNRTEEIFVSIALMIAATVTLIEVFLRPFGESLGITHELVNYLLIWAGLIGASIGVREKTHLGVDVLIGFFEPKTQKRVLITTTVISVLFSLIIFILGIQHVMDLANFGVVTPEMELPKYIPRLLLPIAFGLMVIRFSQEMYKIWKTKAEELVQSAKEDLLKKEGVTNE